MGTIRRAFDRRALSLAAALLCSLFGCGPSAYDLFIQASQAEQKSARAGCKLVWDENAAAHIVNSSKLTRCLVELKEAQDLYHRAQQAATSPAEYERAVANIDQQVAKVEGMLRMVTQMEQGTIADKIEKEVNGLPMAAPGQNANTQQ
jgi:hypothetical protein